MTQRLQQYFRLYRFRNKDKIRLGKQKCYYARKAYYNYYGKVTEFINQLRRDYESTQN